MIGRYQIHEEVGRGGMSTVYLAHDPHFNRDVAIKLLPHALLHHPTFRARFEREAKIVAALDIPSVVPVYDYGEEDGQPFLVMRYMAGGTLTDRLQKGALSLAETARIMGALAEALDEAHRRGIIHRDLKPSNILFDQQDNPYISDFGTALIMNASIKLTDTGGAVGTPAYMSPEQIRGERTLDGRSDQYALGIIAFEALSGNHPYQTNTPIGIAVKHIIDPVPRILDTTPDLPPYCQAIIARSMAKNPKDRYPTATAFAEALKQAALSDSTGILHPSNSQPESVNNARTLPWRAGSTSRWLWLSVILLIALLIGGGILSANKQMGTVTITAVTPPITGTETETKIKTGTPGTVEAAATEVGATAVALPTQTALPASTQEPINPAPTDEVPVQVTAVAAQSASIYAQPDISSAELAIIFTGDMVTIHGRSENGHWLYVSNENGVTGFVAAARLGVANDLAILPVVTATATSINESETAVCAEGCPPLWIDAYPLPGGRCEGNTIYRTIYMRGQGGSGVYTYYWEGKKMAGPLQGEGFGFEINNLNGTVIGWTKVVSSDGQTAEKELFISEFTCE